MSWTRKPLKDVADFSLGKMLDENKNKGQLMPYLANINVRWGSFELDDLRQMRFGERELDRFGLKSGDIVMCEGGVPGRCAIWQDQISGMMFQKALHRIRPHECIDSKFLFYRFLKMGRNNEFSGLFTGATIKHLPKDKLAKVIVAFPEIEVQRKIAEVLSAYDDLIENNRRRIALLEQATRLLYEEWFVRFRFPGHDHVKKVNGLPVGWKMPTLGEYAPFQYGKALREDQRVDGDVPVYGSSGRVGKHNKPFVDEPGIIIGRKGNVGAVYFSEAPFWPIDTTYYIDNEKVSRFLFYALQRLQFINTDVAVPGLNRDFAHSRELIVPTDPILSHYEEKVAPLFSMAKLLERQNTQLQVARDLLLLRLMSGEVEV